MEIKVCGLTDFDNAMGVADLGVDYLGVIVDFASSPRSLSVVEAEKMAKKLKEAGVKAKLVAVMVDPIEVDLSSFDIVQLHGDESVEFCKGIDLELWKAVVVKDESELRKIELYKDVASKILLDGGRGAGKEIELDLSDVDFDVLAGGLNARNVKGLVKKYQPKVIDLNSGVESSPGVKDLNMLKEVLELFGR